MPFAVLGPFQKILGTPLNRRIDKLKRYTVRVTFDLFSSDDFQNEGGEREKKNMFKLMNNV